MATSDSSDAEFAFAMVEAEAEQSARAKRAAWAAVGFVEFDFWERSVDPTRHALERFAERAAPPAFDWPYLGWALRDLAVAEGWISEHPPPGRGSPTPPAGTW